MSKVKRVSFLKKIGSVIALSAGLFMSHAAFADDINQYWGGLASGEYKFLGNISGLSNQCNCSYTDYINPSNQSGFDVFNHFTDYWNQMSPENSGKWGVVQSSIGNLPNWSQLQTMFNYTQYHGVLMKEHTLVWGSQLPSDFSGSKSDVETWIHSACDQLEAFDGWTSGHSPLVDVVNEPVNTTTSAFTTFKNSIGPSDIGEMSSTGWDWVIWSFQKARAYCPHEKLLLNEYNVLHTGTTQNTYKQIAQLLKDKGLIDGLGTQSHQGEVDGMSATQVNDGLNSLDETGIPLYVTELDIDGCDVNGSGGGGTGVNTNSTNCTSESIQNTRYQAVFPTLWEHSTVQGITLWGYVQNENWFNGTYLINTNGTDRSAMTWLKSYFSNRALNNVISANNVAYSYLINADRTITIRAHGHVGGEKIRLRVNNQIIGAWTLTTSWHTYTSDSTLTGDIRVEFYNDNGPRDAYVDYIKINGSVRQAENYLNTGICGEPGYNQAMHCNGYIDFGAL